MTMTSKYLWVGLIAVVIIAVVFALFRNSSTSFGAALPTDGAVSRTLGTIYSYTNGQNGIVPGIWSDGVLAFKNYLQFNAGVDATSAATSTSYIETATITTCSTASSTIFAVQNPFAPATSTAVYVKIDGIQGASTTDIMIGTSTTGFLPLTTSTATSSLGANILALSGVTNAVQFSLLASADSGYEGDGVTAITVAKSNAPIQVSPTSYIYGFSTSTNPANGAGGRGTGQLGVPASCTVHIKWAL